jgi:hypothetical protein
MPYLFQRQQVQIHADHLLLQPLKLFDLLFCFFAYIFVIYVLVLNVVNGGALDLQQDAHQLYQVELQVLAAEDQLRLVDESLQTALVQNAMLHDEVAQHLRQLEVDLYARVVRIALLRIRLLVFVLDFLIIIAIIFIIFAIAIVVFRLLFILVFSELLLECTALLLNLLR